MAKNIFHRESGSTYCPKVNTVPTPVIGWFSNKFNAYSGWILHELEDWTKVWLKEKGIDDTTGMYRTFSHGINTINIVKINTETGTYAFVDGKHLGETDEVKFERAVKAKEIWFDDLPAKKAAG